MTSRMLVLVASAGLAACFAVTACAPLAPCWPEPLFPPYEPPPATPPSDPPRAPPHATSDDDAAPAAARPAQCADETRHQR